MEIFFFRILSILSGLSVCLEEVPLMPVHSFISIYCPYGGNIYPCTHNLNIKRDESFSQAVNKGKLSINLTPVAHPLFPPPNEGNLWLKLKKELQNYFPFNLFVLDIIVDKHTKFECSNGNDWLFSNAHGEWKGDLMIFAFDWLGMLDKLVFTLFVSDDILAPFFQLAVNYLTRGTTYWKSN